MIAPTVINAAGTDNRPIPVPRAARPLKIKISYPSSLDLGFWVINLNKKRPGPFVETQNFASQHYGPGLFGQILPGDPPPQGLPLLIEGRPLREGVARGSQG